MTFTLRQLADTRGPHNTVVAARRLAYVAVFIGFAAAVPDLNASCGDYVMIGGEHAISMHGHAGSPGSADSTFPPATRCQGPNCHRQAPVPTAPSREPPPTRSTDRACWLAAVDQSSLAVEWLAASESVHVRDGYRRAIEHPPRLAS